jgi:hypothetical protein
MKFFRMIFKRGYLLQKVCYGRYRVRVSRFFQVHKVGYLDLYHVKETWHRKSPYYTEKCVGSYQECVNALQNLRKEEG